MDITMYGYFSGIILDAGIEKACETAVSLGYTSVEDINSMVKGVRNAIPDVTAASQAKNVLDQYGLPVVCHSVIADVWNNKNAEKELKEQADIAKELGAPYLHHTLLPWLTLSPDTPNYNDAIRTAVNVAAKVAHYAETLGITCIYEDQGYYVNGVKGFGGFFDEMKKRCENVGVCGDLGNILFVNEAPESFLEDYIKDIRHIHIKDYLRKKDTISPGLFWMRASDNNWLRDTMVGSGVVNFEACIKVLKEAGYQGAFSLELSPPEPFEEGTQQAIQYLKRFWEK